MGVPGNANPLLLVQAAEAAAGYEIERSLRFNPSDSASLTKTFSATGSQTTYTFSFWLKKNNSSSVYQNILIDNNSSSSQIRINDTTGGFELRFAAAGASAALTTNRKFRDPSGWYHIVCVYDSTNATSSDRMRIYVNGIRETSFLGETQPTQNLTSPFITNGHTYTIGYFASNTALDGYLADVYFIDGQALDPTDFGEFDATTGVWNPIEYAGNYGTNGFHLPFSDNSSASALGTDDSGNGNSWTTNNISVASGAGNDSLRDSPTNGDTADDTGAGGEVPGNYATWNPLTVNIGSGTIGCSNGNLGFGTTASSSYGSVISTIAPSSGKFYCELSFEGTKASLQNRDLFGIVPVSEYSKANRTDIHRVLNALTFDSTGSAGYAHIGTGTSYTSTSYGSGGWDGTSIVGIAIDFDTPSVVFYVDGVSQGTFPHSMVAGESYAIFAVDWDNGVGITNYILNAGQRAFAYQNPGTNRPSADYKPLCTAFLDTPTIEDGSTAMDVALYTGNGSTQTISGLEFSPDLVWTKARSAANSHALWDTVRGVEKRLISNATDAEATRVGGLTAFTSDGFTHGNDSTGNDSSTTYVAWTWDGGSSTVSNTDGSITSSVRANPTAGFSIVSYTGVRPGAQTVGHGLNAAPGFAIFKNRTNSGSWAVYHSSLGPNTYIVLDSAAVGISPTSIYNNTAPTSSVFTVGEANTTNENGGDHIALCWAPVEGYNAFGSYTGNGSSTGDGPFVYTGFRIKFLMIKIYSGTASNWVILDSTRDPDNVVQNNLYADAQDAENQFDWADFLSNGFKLRVNYNQVNGSGYNYIYAAFAENPFKYARAR